MLPRTRGGINKALRNLRRTASSRRVAATMVMKRNVRHRHRLSLRPVMVKRVALGEPQVRRPPVAQYAGVRWSEWLDIMRALASVTSFVVIALVRSLVVSCDIQSDFRQLPRLFTYDDFDECRREEPSRRFVYCVVRVTVHPDDGSPLWRNISALTKDSRNFPHNILERGMCLTSCDSVDQTFATCATERAKAFYHFPTAAEMLSCVTEKDFDRATTLGERIFLWMSVCLFGLVLIASYKDFHGSSDVLTLAFSLRRNLRNLLPRPSAEGELPFLEGLRALGMLTILVVHSQLPMIRMPLRNPEDMERQTNSVIFPFINSGNTHMIQFFFALGGMVFAISCLRHFERRPNNFRAWYFLEKLIRRLYRLVPAYAFVVFYQATWYKRAKQGPLAEKFADYCTDHWWSNMLFVNNYVHVTEPCLQYSWYLGADFQLFLAGSAIMACIWKFPRSKPFVVAVMAASSFLVPGIVIYVAGLDATMSFHMRHALTELRMYDQFLKFYLPFHTNIGSYFFGMITAMLCRDAAAKTKLQQQKLQTIVSGTFDICLVLFVGLSGFTMLLPYIRHVPGQPSLVLAIYGSLLKAIWGIAFSVLFLHLSLKSRQSSLFVSFLEHPMLGVLAKLSYTVYLVQYSIIYTIYSNLPLPVVYGGFNGLLILSAVLILAFASAWLLHTAIEVPVAHLAKMIVDQMFHTAPVRPDEAHERSTVHQKMP